jgi:predicted ATPase/DNA-binding CsgD family transcriptional regulator
LITLTGPGGVGKTRLAIQAAEAASTHFPGGMRVFALATVVDAGRVMPAIGAELGIAERDPGALIEQIAAVLGDKRTLLLLDNLEQVPAVAPALEDLLERQPKVVVLVTSRVPMRIAAEQEFVVLPMPLPGDSATSGEPADSATLFIERVGDINPRFTVTGANREAIDEICQRLDGLPLAIELAAARTRVMLPEAIVPWLSNSLRLLTGGPVDQPARQRTMRDAIAWSYGLLSDAEQQAFRRLAIFRGTFTEEAATAALGENASEVLAALHTQSLLQALTGDEPRYRMLQTIREFGLEQLEFDPGSALAQRRVAGYWIEQAEAVASQINALEALSQATARLQRDHDNLRGSLDWLEDEDRPSAFRLLARLFWFYYSRSYHAEALERHEQLLARSRDGVAPELLGSVLLGAGAFAHFQGRSDLAGERLDEALQILESTQQGWALGFCRLVLGVRAEDAENYDEATLHFAEAIRHLEQAGDRGTADSARYHLAIVAFGRDRLDQAREQLIEVLDREGEPPRIGAWAMQLRALIAVHDRESALACAQVRESLLLFQTAGSAAGQNAGFSTFAVVASAAGRPDIAAEFFGLADRLNRARGDVVTGAERRRYDAAEAATRERLGEHEFGAAFHALDDWSVDAAIERVLTIDLSRSSGSISRVSPRERDVLALLVTGATDEEIAGELFLSTRTVHAHLGSIYRKLQVNNRSEAVRLALERGLAERP